MLRSQLVASKNAGRNLLVVLGLAGFVLPAAGCDLPLHTATETVSEVFATDSAPRIIVETFNGSIDISNGAADEVVVEVTKRASGINQESAEANLENVELSFTESADAIHIKASRVRRVPNDCGASVVIAAPKGATVELKTSNGYVVSEGMQGSLKASSSNGRVSIFEGTGKMELETSNGAIEIEATAASVQADTSNGRIQFTGSLTDGPHRFGTSNGGIEIKLPGDSSFQFEASTSHGRIDCEFPVADKESKGRRELSGTVGSTPNPPCHIELSTSNGSIDIERAERKVATDE